MRIINNEELAYLNKVAEHFNKLAEQDPNAFVEGSDVLKINFEFNCDWTGYAPRVLIQWPAFRDLVFQHTVSAEMSKLTGSIHFKARYQGVLFVAVCDKFDLRRELRNLPESQRPEFDESDDVHTLFTRWQQATGWNGRI